ncbi:hypothetical protein PC120_g20052 [Phytophthora cactorum]|nr:hypothetical protein PC120_g20052 [Phytophthora cactorum]
MLGAPIPPLAGDISTISARIHPRGARTGIAKQEFQKKFLIRQSASRIKPPVGQAFLAT